MLLILLIATVNLVLGFAIALYLGRGPRQWSDLDEAVRFEFRPLPRWLTRKKLRAGSSPK